LAKIVKKFCFHQTVLLAAPSPLYCENVQILSKDFVKNHHTKKIEFFLPFDYNIDAIED